ncbi:MAG: hypothetical protein KAI79_14195 [Bacteroidales bacterium]|nr:hypothetical protein [Bacteroidales bacterium]
MTRNSIHVFDDMSSTGVDKVHNNGLMLVKDYDGLGNPELMSVNDKSLIDSNTTISTVVSNNDHKFNFSRGQILNTDFQYDTTYRSFGTTYADGKIWNNIAKHAGNEILISWHVPFRHETDAWSGGYVDILYSINGGSSYVSLGDSGYDGNVMFNGTRAIACMAGTLLVDVAEVVLATQIRFKFRHKAYSGTVLVNQDHAIVTGASGMFWTNMTIMEIRK